MKLFKRKYLLVIPLVLIFLGAVFYWYEWRPIQIKHECSWVKKHRDAVPARVGKTEAQLKAEGKIKTCPPTPTLKPGQGYLQQLFESGFCNSDNQKVINENKPQKYIPAKTWYVKATKEEYNFCIHDKGL